MSSASQLRQLADTPIRDPISPEDLAAVLGSAPFISTPGAFNLRDMGLVPGSALRSGLVYRSAKLGPVQSEWIANKVGVVFDLRRPAERDKSPDPTVDGVPNVWNPPQAPYDAPNLAEFAIGDGSEAWGAQYLRVLKGYAVTFRQVLEHVRDRPGVPFLFHCTAGRDRTGVLAGILHGVAGTSPSASQLDYLISRIGTEPRRTELMMLVANSLGAGDKDAAGLENLASLRPSFWTLFIEGMQREYGDWDGYVRWLGFSDKDIAVIRSNLREQQGRL